MGEANHPSPVSVLEAPYKEELSSSSECLGSVSTDISGKMTITASHYINQHLWFVWIEGEGEGVE